METQTPVKTKSRKGEIRKCSICQETGHIATGHYKKTAKVCIQCKIEKPIDDFLVQTHKPNSWGRYYEQRMSYCRDCNKIRSRARYTGSFRARFMALVNAAKKRQQRLGIKVSITANFLLEQLEKQKGLCFYSGKPVSLETGNNAVSIDRIDPFGDYSPENTVLTTWLVNMMKRQQTQEEFVDLCKSIANKFE